MTPDWIDPADGDGRQIDLTGMRLSPQTLEARLLDGLTTITPLPRYLTFRAWIIRRYIEARQPDRWRDFIGFAGRQECALAMGHALLDYKGGGVVGINQGRRAIHEKGARLPLSKLTQQTATHVYRSSAEALKFTHFPGEPANVPVLTPAGQALSAVAESRLGHTRYGRLLKSNPQLASARRKDLEEFAEAFPPHRPDDQERSLILDAMFARRAAQGYRIPRRATYGLLLYGCNRHPGLDVPGFLELVSTARVTLPRRFRGIADAWCEYALRDMLAEVYEAALCCVTDALQARSSKERTSDPDAVVHDACEAEDNAAFLDHLGLGSPGRAVRSLRTALTRLCSDHVQEHGGLRRWRDGLDEAGLVHALRAFPQAGPAALAIAWCLAARRISDPEKRPLADRHGNAGLQANILPLLDAEADASVRQLMAQLALRAAMQHLRIAWERFAVDPERNIALFSVDERRWTFYRGYGPGRMATRLDYGLRWLADLGVVNAKGLTSQGKSLLTEVSSDPVQEAA